MTVAIEMPKFVRIKELRKFQSSVMFKISTVNMNRLCRHQNVLFLQSLKTVIGSSETNT